MSTLDNIMTGRLLRMRRGLFWQAIYTGPAEREELEHRAYVERLIDFLAAIRKPVGQLAYGCRSGSNWRAPWRWSRNCRSTSRWPHECRGEGGHAASSSTSACNSARRRADRARYGVAMDIPIGSRS
jgi:hypothetical protein